MPKSEWTAPDDTDHDKHWVVLIGEGSDSEEIMRFLNDVWPEVDDLLTTDAKADPATP